jgi:K+-dependent Na+/Ca+ exchanger-like protein
MLILYTLGLLVCFLLLARVVDLFFIASLDDISNDMHLTSDAAGATLMAVGSSAPELFVALFSVFKPGGHQAIGIGSIVGSAIFNLLIIVGAIALVRNTKLTWQPAVRDLFFYTFSVALLVWFIWDGRFCLIEAVIFLTIYLLYIITVVYWKKLFTYVDNSYIRQERKNKSRGFIAIFDKMLFMLFPNKKNSYLVFLISILIIAGVSWTLVELAIIISHILNIPEAIIALTVLAIGTSVPDLISSLIVAKEGRGDMAVSNAIGSNIFDILVGLGLPMLIYILFSGNVVNSDGEISSSAIILFSSVIFLLIWLLISKWKIGKITGFFLVGIYILYVIREILLL